MVKTQSLGKLSGLARDHYKSSRMKVRYIIMRKITLGLPSAAKHRASKVFKLGRGTVKIRFTRRISTAVSIVLASTMVIFGGVAVMAAGTVTITTSNATPPLNQETGLSAPDAGIVGDQIVIKSSAALTAPVSVTFNGTQATNVTPSTGISDTFTVTIPSGATTGILAVSDSAANVGTIASYGIWASRSEPWVMPSGHLNLTLGDLRFLLDQIKIGEAHAARTSNATAVQAAAFSTNTIARAGTASSVVTYPFDVLTATRCLRQADFDTAAASGLSNSYLFDNLQPWGLRQIDGQCNNITNVTAETKTGYTPFVNNRLDTAGWGSTDQFFTRMVPSTIKPGVVAPYTLNAWQKAYANPGSYVKDAQPRVISNLIADQTNNNPAAVAASEESFATLYGSVPNTETAVNATTSAGSTVMQIPNVTADFNVSAGYNSWFTLFGQFFDHGLDLIPKGGAQVFIPLEASDPIYVQGSNANYMVLTRGADATGEAINLTSPWIDNSQTYGSHASQNFFLREYSFDPTTGVPSPTGALLSGTDPDNRLVSNEGEPTWYDLKAQTLKLGFRLTDYDAPEIPVIATNQYGRFIAGPNGFPMMLFKNAGNQYLWVEGNRNNPVLTSGNTGANASLAGYTAVGTGHNFINDTMGTAVPLGGSGNRLTPDADSIINSPSTMVSGYYDDEALNEHYIAGDGRVNENIGLVAVHSVFHAEHNLLVNDIKTMLLNSPVITPAFLAEFRTAGVWNGERLFHAAKLVNEMEYQHLVFDEFARRLSPSIPAFLAYEPTTRAEITQEFASAVYRLGHSMLNETIARSNPGTTWSATSNQDVSLVTGFTTPALTRLKRPAVIASATSNSTSSITYTVASNETTPKVGAIVTVTGLEAASFNVSNAVVDSRAGNTFTVSSRYSGGSQSTPVGFSVTYPQTTVSKTYTTATSGGTTSGWTNKDATNYVARAVVTDPGFGINGYDYTTGESVAAVAQGMTQQRGNEIDEFTTDSVRNNLLGLPLDLPSLNLTRGRDVGLPTLNQFRARNAGSLKPYASWADFKAALRYQASAVNFIAAYGTYPTLLSKAVATSTKATSTTNTNTYTVNSTAGINVGDVVSISGFSTARFNLQSAVVASKTPTTLVIQKQFTKAPTETNSFGTGTAGLNALVASMTPTNLVFAGSASQTLSAAATISRTLTAAEKRTEAEAIVLADTTAKTDFLNARGTWAGKETGINNIDLWIGGLAENPTKQPVTPAMLGPTFQFVFDAQLTALQNGDRMYYLHRLPGTNVLDELQPQKLIDIVRRNTPSLGNGLAPTVNRGIVGAVSPSFGIGDCYFSPTLTVPDVADPSQGGNTTMCPANTMRVSSTGTLTHDGLDNIVGFGDQGSTSAINISGGMGDDSIQGSGGNDRLDGGLAGGDLIQGYQGDDIIFGGAGEDVIGGNYGNDVIDAGESQAGDIADGGPGVDFLHNSNATGGVLSLIGEAGDDYIQGGKGADGLLQGGEGSDWIEGNAGVDLTNGDHGPNGALGDMWNGGDDVINGGAGDDASGGDGGDDIFTLGDGIDLAAGGMGFDWVNYNGTARFDNGPTEKAAAFLDLSGALINPLNLPGDGALEIEGIAGSSGNDTLGGSQAQNQTLNAGGNANNLPGAGQVRGLAGQAFLIYNGTTTTIDIGMVVTGSVAGQIPAYTTTAAAAGPVTIGGNAMTQIPLSAPLRANVTGTVSFKTQALKRPGAIQGLTSLIAGTPGSQVGAGVPLTVAGEWSGGSIIVGGAGNDSLYANGGSNVIHGSAKMQTCIVVTHNGAVFDTNADVNCDGRMGYSSMTPLLTYLNSGAIRSTDLRIVKELVATSSPITGVQSTGGNTTFIAKNNYAIGDLVTVTGMANAAYNVNRVAVASATPTSFTLATAVANTALISATGNAVQSDTLYLPGLQNTYTIERLSVLPVGASVGYKITGATGIDYVYDVSQIVFDAFGTPVTVNYNPNNATGVSAPLTSLAITGAILTPAFNPTIREYTAIASAATVTVTPAAPNGASLFVNAITARGTTGTATPTAVNLVNGAGTITVRTSVANTSYTIRVVAGGMPVSFDEPQATASGFTVNVLNCNTAAFTYTAVLGDGSPVVVGAQAGNACPVAVSGLAARQAATLYVTATPIAGGYQSATSSVTGMSAIGSAASITFDTPVGTADGFTVHITDYNAAFTYTGDAPGGSVAIVGGTVTVSGLAYGDTALLTVTASRADHPSSSATVVGSTGATLGYANVPVTSTPTSTSDGFTFVITNYDAAFNYSLSVVATSETADVAIDANYAAGQALVTVSGLLLANEQATVTIDTSRLGYPNGSASVSNFATSNPGTAPTLSAATPINGGFTFNITNFDGSVGHYQFTGATAQITDAGVTTFGVAVVTVSGLGVGATATVNVVHVVSGFTDASNQVVGQANGGAALTPVIGTVTPNATGFVFTVTNYNAAYNWSTSAPLGVTVSTPAISGSTATYTVTGLTLNGAATVYVYTSRVGYDNGSTFFAGSATQTGLTATVGVATKPPTGAVTVQITNYSNLYGWTVRWSAGGTAPSTAGVTVSNTGLISITGLNAAQRRGAITLTIVTSRTNYTTVTVNRVI